VREHSGYPPVACENATPELYRFAAAAERPNGTFTVRFAGVLVDNRPAVRVAIRTGRQ